MTYLKAFHVVFMVTWFAGLFYLPRLYVYHAQLGPDEESSHQRFCVMERKLYIIMSIGAVLTAVAGFVLLFHGWGISVTQWPLWLLIKLPLVLLLIVYHFYCQKLMLDFRARRNQRSHVFYRWFNEGPAILLIAIVILAILKYQ